MSLHRPVACLFFLLLVCLGCGSDPPPAPAMTADARPGTGGSGGSGGGPPAGNVTGGSGGARGGIDAAAGADAPAGSEAGPADRQAGPADGNRPDGSAMTIAPPRYPPRGVAVCAPGCADLRARYA